MLIKDEGTQAFHEYQTEQERIEQALLDYGRKLWESSRFLDTEHDPTNVELRHGRRLHHEDIERRLLRLNANLRFTPHPNPTKRCVYFVEPTGALEFVCPMEAGLVPENSIMSRAEEVTLTPAGAKDGFKIAKADLPPSETRPYEWDEYGRLKVHGSVEFEEGSTLPGQRMDIVPWAEIVRGYRTVGNILIQRGIIGVADFEREFGTQNSASWAAASGRRKKVTPW